MLTSILTHSLGGIHVYGRVESVGSSGAVLGFVHWVGKVATFFCSGFVFHMHSTLAITEVQNLATVYLVCESR